MSDRGSRRGSNRGGYGRDQNRPEERDDGQGPSGGGGASGSGVGARGGGPSPRGAANQGGNRGGGGGRGRGQGQTGRGRKPRNAYWYFITTNCENRDFNEASAALSHVWQNLSPANRAVYVAMARQDKEDLKGTTTKYTSTGVSCDVIEKEISAIKDAVEKETSDINDSIDYAAETDIMKKQFFIIHTNYYCATKDQVYPTCEIAIARFSLETGVDLTYHTLVESVIPLGYASDAMAMSTKIGIPMPPLDGAEDDYVKMFYDVKNFISNCTTGYPKDEGMLPPVYALTDDVKPIKNFLAQISDAADEDCAMFRVYLLPKLFHKLRNTVSLDDMTYPLTLANEELSLSTFGYISDLACEFHTDLEEFPNCSLLKVKKSSYILCDHCCKQLGIALIPGKHIPFGIHPTPSRNAGANQQRPENNQRGNFPSGSSRRNYANQSFESASVSGSDPDDFQPVVSRSRRGRGRGNNPQRKNY